MLHDAMQRDVSRHAGAKRGLAGVADAFDEPLIVRPSDGVGELRVRGL